MQLGSELVNSDPNNSDPNNSDPNNSDPNNSDPTNSDPGSRLACCDVDALRLREADVAGCVDADGVDVEVHVIAPLRRHRRRGCREDDEVAALAHPVDVAVAVHHDGAAANAKQVA